MTKYEKMIHGRKKVKLTEQKAPAEYNKKGKGLQSFSELGNH
jgi:hypothetical protein